MITFLRKQYIMKRKYKAVKIITRINCANENLTGNLLIKRNLNSIIVRKNRNQIHASLVPFVFVGENIKRIEF